MVMVMMITPLLLSKTTALVVVFIIFSSTLTSIGSSAAEVQKCQRIDHEMCNDLPYNLTSFPNIVGEETFKHAAESISTYKPLLSVVCSEQLKFFLCSVYFPMCNEKVPYPIGPCRPLCLSVQEKCLPVLQGFGFSWPDVIRCDKFPLENNREKMCMKGPNEQGAIQHEKNKHLALDSGQMEEDDGGEGFRRRDSISDPRQCGIDEVYLNRTSRCVPLCSNSQSIAQTERESSTRLLLFLASSSVILTLLTFFVVIMSRFTILASLSETAMFFSSSAFAVSAIVYIFSISFREQISCTDYTHHLLFVVGGLSHVPCSSVASLIYYFTTCARAWWLLLCCTWNRATTSAQKLQESSVRVQMLVWGLPLAPLMLALLARSISANPLTGICLVGASSRPADWFFNFSRELIFFLISSIALSSACCRLLASSEQLEVNGFAGIIASLYPITSLFYLLSFINDASQPSVGWAKTFNIVSALKFTFDMVLALVMCSCCFVYMLSRVARNPSSKASKEGYQPAVPKLPTPAIPGSVRSNTYASTFRTNMI